MNPKNRTVEDRKKIKRDKKNHRVSAFWVILIAFILAELFFYFVLGKFSNFEKNNPDNRSINLLGTMFKGGFIIPIILTLLLTVIILSIERFSALKRIRGKINLTNFMYDIKMLLKKRNISDAESLCAVQKGSIAAIVDAGLKKYKRMENINISKEQKIERIKIEIEETTALQLPSMEQNLPIIATISTLSTLIGLFGTVLSMIKSFQTLEMIGGAINSSALSVSISEALVNTAAGIATAIVATISYSYFKNIIDNMTYVIDEIGLALVQIYEENVFSYENASL